MGSWRNVIKCSDFLLMWSYVWKEVSERQTGKGDFFHSDKCVLTSSRLRPALLAYQTTTGGWQLWCEKARTLHSDCEPRGAERPRWAGRKLGRAGMHSRALEQQAGLTGALYHHSRIWGWLLLQLLFVSLKPLLRQDFKSMGKRKYFLYIWGL